jgi:hypothetical protein
MCVCRCLATLKQFYCRQEENTETTHILEPRNNANLCYCLHRYSPPFSGWSTVHYKQNTAQVFKRIKHAQDFANWSGSEQLHHDVTSSTIQTQQQQQQHLWIAEPNLKKNKVIIIISQLLRSELKFFFFAFHFFSFVRCGMTGHSHAKFLSMGAFVQQKNKN